MLPRRLRLAKYKSGGTPLDYWTCDTYPDPRKGFMRVKGKFCFDVKGDGRGDECVTAPTTPYYRSQ